MTLSWSPGFCDPGGDEKSPQQCAAGAGAGFVVHGLWPDNRSGPDPEDCGFANASETELATARGLYPTAGLARYEYRKHGTCTGLDARDYFATVRYARDDFTIPADAAGAAASGNACRRATSSRPSSPPTPISSRPTWRSPASAANSSTCASA